jgi:transposase
VEVKRFVGIDVAKPQLDVAIRPSGESFAVANDESRISGLLKRPELTDFVIVEATGGPELFSWYLPLIPVVAFPWRTSPLPAVILVLPAPALPLIPLVVLVYLRFAEWIAPPPRKTRFRMAGQPFRAGLVTRWVPTKAFRSSHPPCPGFTWRTLRRTQGRVCPRRGAHQSLRRQ